MANVGFPQKSSFGVITATEVRTPLVNNPAGSLSLKVAGVTKQYMTGTVNQMNQHVKLQPDVEVRDSSDAVIIASDNAGSIDQLAPITDALGVRTPLVNNPAGDFVVQRAGSPRMTFGTTINKTHRNFQLDGTRVIVDDSATVILGTDDAGHIDELARIDQNVVLNAGVTVDGLDLKTVDDHLALEAANATWIKCALEDWGDDADQFKINAEGRVENVGTGSGRVTYSVPLPTTRGGKDLYISGTRISLADADAGDYIASTVIRGYTGTSNTDIDTDPTDKNTIDVHEDVSMGALDCSGYHAVQIFLATGNGLAGDLEIQFVSVRYFYA